jgi:hypothetical protein
MSDEIKKYGVFAPSIEAFWEWANSELAGATVIANISKRKVRTETAIYIHFRTHLDARGYTLDGIILLKGFNLTAGAWSEVVDTARYTMVA